MKRCSLLLLAAVAAAIACGSAQAVEIRGAMKVWQPVTLTFEGPGTSEQAEPNPFTDYRLTVTFTQDATTYVVPGYYAVDGNAGQTGADSGNKWRVHFVPDRAGTWKYMASFRTGSDIAMSLDPGAGEPTAFDAASGTFKIGPADPEAPGFLSKGFLQYTPTGYLQFAGTGEYFIKAGADSPENFLAYADFDQTYDTDGLDREGEAKGGTFIHRYEPHLQDWKPGDPTWKDGKGKAIIGALNYLASKGMNSVYFITYNLDGGDGKDVWPWTDPKERFRFDCSKLDQWEIVFSHMDRLGLMLHNISQETENDQGLDGGDLGRQRRLYYRELIARFGHHLGITWNLGEENTNTTEQRKAFAKYYHDVDPYDHPVVIHTYPGQYDQVYTPLLGYEHLQGPSLQTNDTHNQVTKWARESRKAGYPWYVSLDEIGPAHTGVKPDKDDPTHDEVRKKHLYGCLMGGGGGVEWYFGYQYAHNDLNCEDWRSRDRMWDQTRWAVEFFHQHLPFPRMTSSDGLVASGNYCLARVGEVYAVYLPNGGTTELDLGDSKGYYGVQWFNPRAGGELLPGITIQGPGEQSLGTPPADPKADWLALVKKTSPTFEETAGVIAVEAEHFASQAKDGRRRWYVMSRQEAPNVWPDGDDSHAESASGGAYVEVLPDTRRTHGDKLTAGENFSNDPGQMAVMRYRVKFNTPGRYYVWVRAYSTGSEDNGLHVGLNGQWPESGRRLQWCEGKNSWRWESRQRTEKNHCGEPGKIFLDIDKPGVHTIQFSMREDGFEFDKWIMTQDRDMARPEDAGPPEQIVSAQ